MRTLTADLLAEQKKENYILEVAVAFWDANDLENHTTYNTAKWFTKTAILSLYHLESPWDYHAQIVIDNSDGYFTNRDYKGYYLRIGYGAHHSQGEEYSFASSMVVVSQQNLSVPGQLLATFNAVGVINMLAYDYALDIPQYTGIDATWTIKDIISKMFDQSLVIFQGSHAYTLSWDSEDSVIDSFCPGASSDLPFEVVNGELRLDKFRELLDYTSCVVRWEEDDEFHIFVPTTTGTSYDYEYNLSGLTPHKFYVKNYTKRLVIPNQVVVYNQYETVGRYSGSATDSDSYAVRPIPKYVMTGVQSNNEAEAVAENILAKARLDCVSGNAQVPMNCGQEIWDYVNIDDSRADDEISGTIQQIIRRYDNNGIFTMDIHFGSYDKAIGARIADLITALSSRQNRG